MAATSGDPILAIAGRAVTASGTYATNAWTPCNSVTGTMMPCHDVVPCLAATALRSAVLVAAAGHCDRDCSRQRQQPAGELQHLKPSILTRITNVLD